MQECFHLGSLQDLRRLEVNLSFNEVQPSALAGVLKNIAKAPELTHLVLELESIRTNPVHLAMALKELTLLKYVSVLDLNISCNSIREEGIYALGDMCAAMPALTTCRCILRKYPPLHSAPKSPTRASMSSSRPWALWLSCGSSRSTS